MNNAMELEKSILLISCYELGHQPVGVAMLAGFLSREGYAVEAIDTSVEALDDEKVKRAWFVGLSVPMHTALRLGLGVAKQVRRINPAAHICFYGLYASLNADYLLEGVADSVVGGEFEQSLVELIKRLDAEKSPAAGFSTTELARLAFPAPNRATLPALEHYARLEYRGDSVLAGYVEASRGCLHHCTHCPIPPVYGGRFFVVAKETVLEDVRQLVSAGARHITFGDPDFLNGPTHSLGIARALHKEFPELTFDFTAKVEHILKYRRLIPEFASLGCLFIVSAVESLSDRVLARLEKGHTRDDVEEALEILRRSSIEMRPSFVSFTPWTTLDDFIEVLDFINQHDLIDNVDPVQYTIRLLIPPGSLLLSAPDSAAWLGDLAQESFTYRWAHPDGRMDELHRKISLLVEEAVGRGEDPASTFRRVRELAYGVRGDEAPVAGGEGLAPLRLRPPRLTEAWFC